MNFENKARLTQEIKTMSRCFPQFKLFEGDGSYSFAPRGSSFWGGRIQTNFGTEYSLAVVYPPNYPHGEIKAFVVELMNEATPHKYYDGHLCLYSNDHGGGGEGLGQETTAATITAWAAAWLNAWEVYKRSGTWPGRQ